LAPGAPLSGARRGRSPGARLKDRASPGRCSLEAKPLNPLPALPPSRRLERLSLPVADPHGARPPFRRLSLPGAEARLARSPGPSPNPPSRGGPPLTAGQAGWREGEKEGFRGGSLGRCALQRRSSSRSSFCGPAPPRPRPIPRRASYTGFTVIPLGAFTGNTSEGRYKKFCSRWLSRENSGGVSVLGCGRKLPGLYYSVVRPLNQLNEPR
jgi:hypothetical protein